jgi:hypothetical protein
MIVVAQRLLLRPSWLFGDTMTQKEMMSLVAQLKNYTKSVDELLVIEDSFDDRENKIKIELLKVDWSNFGRVPKTVTREERIFDAGWIEPAGVFQGVQMVKYTRALDEDRDTFLVEACAHTIFGLLYT